MKVVGLIGGMGSGKSRVAQEFARRGAYVISGDRLGHEALRVSEIKSKIVERWSPAVLDSTGEIDRKKLGRVVFQKPQERKALEALVFPYIERRIVEEIDSARKDPAHRLVILDAAVMLEAGWDRHCDSLVFVDATREVRLARLNRDRGWSDKELESREQAQWPLEKKKERADFVLDNSGTPEELAPRIEALIQKFDVTP